jgi:CBS domain-containing protein
LWPVTSVEQIALACPEDEVVAPDVDALVALAQMQRTGQGRLFVVRNGDLIGVVTLRDLLEVMSARLELEAGRGAADVIQRGVGGEHLLTR